MYAPWWILCGQPVVVRVGDAGQERHVFVAHRPLHERAVLGGRDVCLFGSGVHVVLDVR